MEKYDIEKVGLIAQEISFTYEDCYHDKEKTKRFNELFNRFLTQVDAAGTMEPYDAVIALWRKLPAEFALMLEEMKANRLIGD